MCGGISLGKLMLGLKLPDIYSIAFFRQEVVEHTLNLTLTRNCYWVWRTGTMC